jgi:hypothetical protein
MCLLGLTKQVRACLVWYSVDAFVDAIIESYVPVGDMLVHSDFTKCDNRSVTECLGAAPGRDYRVS